jgi:hypothetical protein
VNVTTQSEAGVGVAEAFRHRPSIDAARDKFARVDVSKIVETSANAERPSKLDVGFREIGGTPKAAFR